MNVIGNEKVFEDLKKLGEKKKLGNAYIFFGEPSVGKRQVAEALAHHFESGAKEKNGGELAQKPKNEGAGKQRGGGRISRKTGDRGGAGRRNFRFCCLREFPNFPPFLFLSPDSK